MFKNRNVTTIMLLVIFIGLSTGFGMNDYKAQSFPNSSKANKKINLAKNSQKLEDKPESNQTQMRERKTIKGKKIYSIGDSITYADNNNSAIGKITGYQNVFRQAGAKVESYGVSGATYKEYSKTMSSHKHQSLYRDIVIDKKAKIKNPDIITVFAGTNDVSSNFIIGDQSSLENPQTTLGGFNLLIQYLKEETNAEIIVFSPIYSSRKERPKKNMEILVSELGKVAEMNQVRYVDLYHDFDINSKTANKYLYDQLHPNNEGMKAIGLQMLDQLQLDEGTTSITFNFWKNETAD